MTVDYQAIGTRIRECRKEKGYSQKELAEIANISHTNVSHIERGMTKLSLPTLIKVSDALKIHPGYLLAGMASQVDGISDKEINEALSGFSIMERQFLVETIPSLIGAFRKYRY